MSFPTNFLEKEAQAAIMRLKGEIIDCSICFKPMLYKYSQFASVAIVLHSNLMHRWILYRE